MDVNIRLIKQTVFNHFADTISIKVKVLMQLLAERVGVWLLVHNWGEAYQQHLVSGYTLFE